MMAIFLCCSGLGLGNATRSLAIAEELREQCPAHEIHVFTWGRALDFWKSQGPLDGVRIHPLKGYGTAFGLRNIFFYFVNTIRLWRARRRFRPQFVMLDSDYHFGAFFLRRFPLFFLGQAYDVLVRAGKVGFKPRSFKERMTFFFRERLDFCAQSFFCDRIFVPTLSAEPIRSEGKVFAVPLIVRNFFLAPPRATSEKTPYAVVASGSGWGREQLAEVASSLQEDLRIPPVHPLVSESLFAASAILTQGGLSSISECLAINKFCVCVPLSGHPEQEINARTLEALGLGIALRTSDPGNAERVRIHLAAFRAAPSRPRVSCDGAREISRRVVVELQRSGSGQNRRNLCLPTNL